MASEGDRAGAGDCFAPQYVCEALLRAEGFPDVRYVDTTVQAVSEDLGHGKFDFQSNVPAAHIVAIDHGLPITAVTGVHAGCYELFAHDGRLTSAVRWDRIDVAFRNGAIADLALLDFTALLERVSNAS